MPLDLPEAIVSYFAAENGDGTVGLGQCSTADAVVQDEGQTIHGGPGIKDWMARTKTKYAHTVEPLAVGQKDGQTVVTTRLTGNFRGSPIEVDFAFGLEGGKIRFLEVG
jgi:hypothetical protein